MVGVPGARQLTLGASTRRWVGTSKVYTKIVACIFVLATPTEDLEAMEAARQQALDDILDSAANRRLIVGGPGTGKTYTFNEIIGRYPDTSDIRVLTFINLLKDDLEAELPDHVDVSTFHGYARYLLHSEAAGPEGGAFYYYPPLYEIVVQDADYLEDLNTDVDDIKNEFHRLNVGSHLLKLALRIGEYYSAVSFDDSVYRLVEFLKQSPDKIPSHDLVIVDEYQDFNRMETELLELLSRKSPLVMAGDDDQAIYVSLKGSSPEFIRARYAEDRTTEFQLPFCSRCPQPIVDSVNHVVEVAQSRGFLDGRIAKDFICYLPDKLEDSENHPKLIHARCSVNRKSSPHMGRYVSKIIDKIPEGYIRNSHVKGHPTVLVIGKNPFLTSVSDVLRDDGWHVASPRATEPEVDILDAFDLLADNRESRLGWRILLKYHPPDDVRQIVKEAINAETDIVDLLEDGFRQGFLDLVDVFERISEGGSFKDTEAQSLAEALNLPVESLEDVISQFFDSTDERVMVSDPPTGEPVITCTSWVGAKGLSAELVFLVGMVDGFMPRDRDTISDDEICSFIVGLSRTLRECHLVSCKYFGGQVQPSVFIDWVRPYTDYLWVDKEYLER